MRVKTAIALMVLICGLSPLAAQADELFRRGPIVCNSASAKITSLGVGQCQVQKTPGGGFYSGTCDGRIAIDGEEIQFVVSGQAKRIDYVYPDNKAPLTFDYQGLTCTVQSPRLKTVQNCHMLAKGIGKECQVCAITAAKVCFNVRVDVTVKTKAKKVAETGKQTSGQAPLF
jgi:hypothetical protein